MAVLCFIPELGHVIPLLRIARAARDAGFSVRAFVPDETEFLVGRFGLEADFIGSVTPPGADLLLADMISAAGTVFHPARARRYENQYWVPLLLHLAGRIHEFRSRVEQFNPAIVLADSHVCGWLYRAAAPSVPHLVHIAAGSNFGCQAPGVMEPDPLRRGMARLGDWRDRSLYWGQLRLGRLARNKGWLEDRERRRELKDLRNVVESQTPDVMEVRLATGVGRLEHRHLGHRIRPCPDVTFLGALDPCVGEPLDAGLKDWLEICDKPVALVSFGSSIPSANRVARAVMRGLSLAGVRVLWASGEGGVAAGESESSEDLRRENFIPQPEVLSHPNVSVFVTHAGSGGVQDGIWNAKPMVCVPVVSDQPYNARVIEALGGGICVPAWTATAEGIQQAVERLLREPAYGSRVTELSEELRRDSGGRQVVELMERILRNAESDKFPINHGP